MTQKADGWKNYHMFSKRIELRLVEETPFSMTYGAEAVIPLETGFPTMRTNSFNPSNNDEHLKKNLDLIEEKRENAMVQIVGTVKNPAWGKLGPNWKGPYRITSEAGVRAYFLEDLDEHVVPRPWNVNNLKRYYY